MANKQMCLLRLYPKFASSVVRLLERSKQGLTGVAPLLQCNTWQAPPDSGFSRVECWPMDFDDPDKYLENMSQLQSLNVLVSAKRACGALVARLRMDLLTGHQPAFLGMRARTQQSNVGLPWTAAAIVAPLCAHSHCLGLCLEPSLQVQCQD